LNPYLRALDTSPGLKKGKKMSSEHGDKKKRKKDRDESKALPRLMVTSACGAWSEDNLSKAMWTGVITPAGSSETRL
jgi:hypothetical protein